MSIHTPTLTDRPKRLFEEEPAREPFEVTPADYERLRVLSPAAREDELSLLVQSHHEKHFQRVCDFYGSYAPSSHSWARFCRNWDANRETYMDEGRAAYSAITMGKAA